MNEVEVKLPVTREQAQEILLMGKDMHIVETTDIYYDTKGRGTLRVRVDQQEGAWSEETSCITCKGPKTIDPDTGITSREELEIPIVANLGRDTHCAREDFQKLFKMLGYEVLAIVKKRRTSFQLTRYVTVCVDIVNSLGSAMFVEIEVVSKDPKDALKKIEQAKTFLGLDGIEPETRGYLDMVLERQKNEAP